MSLHHIASSLARHCKQSYTPLQAVLHANMRAADAVAYTMDMIYSLHTALGAAPDTDPHGMLQPI